MLAGTYITAEHGESQAFASIPAFFPCMDRSLVVSYACFFIKLCVMEDSIVAGTCDICGKGKLSGNKVSHANNRSKKFSKPNLQPIRAVAANGSHVRMHVCTRCIRSGKVTKVS
jgi:large subunit ribosomal protein L28